MDGVAVQNKLINPWTFSAPKGIKIIFQLIGDQKLQQQLVLNSENLSLKNGSEQNVIKQTHNFGSQPILNIPDNKVPWNY